MSETRASYNRDIQLAQDDYHVDWVPVYIELMQFSGERITIAIAAIDSNQKHRIAQTIAPGALNSAFGKRGQEILVMSSQVAFSLNQYIQEHGSLESWIPPFQNIHIGRVNTSYDNDIESILEHVKNNISCFSAYEATQEPKQENLNTWRDEILIQVINKRPGLEHNFKRPFMNSDFGNKYVIDYVGNDIILNFAELNPRKAIYAQRNNASNKMLQLNSLRRHQSNLKTDHLNLYLKTPPAEILSKNDFSKMTRYLNDLQSNAEDINIEINTVHDAKDVTERILEDAT